MKHQAELDELSGNKNNGKNSKKGGYNAEEAPAAAAPVTKFRDRNWNGMSKTECEEACVERGISKKGKKEDLVTRLINFQQEQSMIASRPVVPDVKPKEKKETAKKNKKKKQESSS